MMEIVTQAHGMSCHVMSCMHAHALHDTDLPYALSSDPNLGLQLCADEHIQM